MKKIKAGGIIKNLDLAKIGIKSVPNRPGIASIVFNALGDKGINIEFIVQAIELNGRANMTFCIGLDDLDKALEIIKDISKDAQPEKVTCIPGVALLSVFGPHFRENPGVAGLVFSAIADAGVNILAISTSISSISCVIDGTHVDEAIEKIKEFFDIPMESVYRASHGVSIRSGSSHKESDDE